jgi:hypothetical protein
MRWAFFGEQRGDTDFSIRYQNNKLSYEIITSTY